MGCQAGIEGEGKYRKHCTMDPAPILHRKADRHWVCVTLSGSVLYWCWGDREGLGVLYQTTYTQPNSAAMLRLVIVTFGAADLEAYAETQLST